MSLRAHVLAWTMEKRVKGRMAPVGDIRQLRAVLDKASLPTPRNVRFEPGTCGGIAGEWAIATSKGSKNDDKNGPKNTCEPVRRLLYVHGGGFIACSARTHRPITGAFAARGFTVFAPNYRLAPENPFPAGLDDVVAAWRAFSANGPAAVGGDSAGGNLALALLLRARMEGLPMPSAAALFSPPTDLLGTSESYQSNAERDAMFDPDKLRYLVPAYCGDADPAQPLASPLNGDMTGLPPLLLHVGERELMRDDSVRLAAKARAAGVTVVLDVVRVVPHAWQLIPFLPEARTSLDAAAAFLKVHTPTIASRTASAA